MLLRLIVHTMAPSVRAWTVYSGREQYKDGENAVLSLTEKEPRVEGEASSASGKEVRVTVTGLDEKGQMFRETAPVIELNGRDCHFRSKFQPELGSWVLVEFDSSKAGAKKTTVQGQVKSALSDVLAANLYRIHVELETAQELKVNPAAQPVKAAAPAVQPVLVPATATPAAPTPKVEAVLASKEAPTQPVARTKTEPSSPAPFPMETLAAKPAAPFPIETQPAKTAPPAVREVAQAKAAPEYAGLDKEATKAAISQEVKQQVATFKNSFGEELERIALRMVSSNVEPIVRQSIEKQIATNYQSSIQTLNSDLTFQLAGHLANSDALRNSIQNLTKKTLDDQMEQMRNSANADLLNPSERVAEAQQALQKSITEMEERLKVARDSAIATANGVQTMEREISESTARLQKIVDQLNQAARTTIEKFETHMTAQLNSWSAQFKSHVDAVSMEKLTEFSGNMGQQLTSEMQGANEVLEKLSAGLQLARGTVRVQEAQMVERSQALAAEFEKEIKSILVRLAGAL